jgi:predicted HicB family RNase H-like nuclease
MPEDDVSNSEQRKLTGKVLVRFTEEDLQALQNEADRQGTSVPALMRELSLRTLVAQAS